MTRNKRHRQHQQVRQHYSRKQHGSGCRCGYKQWHGSGRLTPACIGSLVTNIRHPKKSVSTSQYLQLRHDHMSSTNSWQVNHNERNRLKTADLVATETGRSARQQTQKTSQSCKLKASTLEAMQEDTAAPESTAFAWQPRIGANLDE